MNATEVIIVDPAAEDAVQKIELAQRLETLVGARVGLIDNSKHMAATLLSEVEKLLQSRYGVTAISRYRKSNPSVPTPPEALAHLLASSDALVHGVAD